MVDRGIDARLTSFDEVLKPVDSLDLVVEHGVPHKGLAMVFGSSLRTPGLARLDDAMQMALMSNLVEAGVGSIMASRPVGSKDYDELKDLFQIPGLPYFSGRDKGDIAIPLYAAIGEAAMFLRDQISQGTDGSGNLVIASSLAQRNNLLTNGSLIYSLGKAFNAKTGIVPITFEGGNIIPTHKQILTMRETMARNLGVFSHLGITNVAGAIDHLTKKLGGKRVLFLDSLDDVKAPQPIFHLDLLMTGLQGSGGREYILVSSLAKAEEILTQEGVLKRGIFDKRAFARWVKANELRTADEKAAEEKLATHIKLLSKEGVRGPILHWARKMLKETYYSTHYSLDSMVANAALYFDPVYSDATKRVTYEAMERLVKEGGFSEDQIVEVPGLIFPNDKSIKRYDLEKEKRAVMYFPAPLYTPANGVQYNQPGKQSRFITVGGLKSFDTYTRNEIKNRTGLNTLQIPTLLAYGHAGSGFRCLAVPIMDR